MKRALLALAALALAACSEPAGLEITIDVGDFKDSPVLRVFLSVPGGFKTHAPEVVENRVTVYSEKVAGRTEASLVIEIPRPARTETFVVTTGNRDPLTITGEALVFNDLQLIATGTNTAPLPIGGNGALKLTVAKYTGPVISAKMRTTDLQEKAADVTVQGTQATPIAAMAVCDFDKDGNDDIAVGLPNADSKLGQGPSGGVFITFGDGTTTSHEVGTGKEFHFYSNESGAKLGTSVACVDLNGDGFGDLIVGAPGSTNGKLTPPNTGKVYVVYGRTNLAQTTIDFTGTKQPDIAWTTSVENAALGSAVFAVGPEGTEPNMILASAPGGTGLVHLFTKVAPSATIINADTPDHTTFAGVKALSLGVGRFTALTGPRDVVLGDPEFLPAKMLEKTGGAFIYKAVDTSKATAYGLSDTGPTGGTGTMIFGGQKSQFGASVLALDSTGMGKQDLFVGAPGAVVVDVGQVYVYEHNDNFFNLTDRPYTTSKATLPGYAPGDQFGRSLARTASGMAPSETWRLIVGAPSTKRGTREHAGAAYMFGSDAARTFPVLEEVFGAATNDFLGTVVAGGQINPDGTGDLVILAPSAKGTVPGAGVVYVKVGQ